MIAELDLNLWNRKKQFLFFNTFEDPFFGITAEVDVTGLLQLHRETGVSFFFGSLYASMMAGNSIENFRYRIRDKKILVHPKVYAGSTILQKNQTFGFCYFPYKDSLTEFCLSGRKSLKLALQSCDFDSRDPDDALIHHSIIPWLSFTQVKHPHIFRNIDSIPKIAFGKYFMKENRIVMPVSVEAHHGLMDGYHIAEYFKRFQNELDSISI
jgi:chloramphenicol O-acetyltransferase type A